jgi:hypothetical protein
MEDFSKIQTQGQSEPWQRSILTALVGDNRLISAIMKSRWLRAHATGFL